MKRLVVLLVAGLLAVPVFAQDALVRIEPLDTVPVLALPNATGGFSVFLPVVARVQGSSTFFYPTIDITNNTSQATDVLFSYTTGEGTKSGTLLTLQGRSNFHSDDFIQLLATNGILTQDQANNSFGTMVLTFTNTSFTNGNEASAVVRIFNYLTGNSGPSIGLAYRAPVLRAGSVHKLTSVIGDTDYPGAPGPKVVTNLGLVNTGIDDNGVATSAPANITLTFLDPRTGSTVGSVPAISLTPGQVMQINDVFSKYSIPGDLTSLVATAESQTGTGAPQIEGYVVLKDVASNDGSFYFMQPLTAAAPPVVTNYDGTWSGISSEALPVSFVVSGNKITSFTMKFVFETVSSSCSTNITITYSVPKTITNGAFNFNFAPTGLSTAISGTFTSATQMNGTFGQVNMTNFMCGTLTINGFKAGGTFTATKQP